MLALVNTVKTKNESSSAKLRSVWDSKKKDLGLTQDRAADKLGYQSQASVSQYLNGDIPLNLQAAIGFARLLGVPLNEVWEGDAEAVFMALPLEDIQEIALNLSYDDQLALAGVLLQNARQRGNEK